MPLDVMHLGTILLASCESSMEAATLSIALPSAKLFCLQPAETLSLGAREPADQDGAAASSTPEWHKQMMLMKVQHGHLSDAMHAADIDEWQSLHISLDHARLHGIPGVFDVLIIPAEGRERLLSLDCALLQRSQLVVSEGIVERVRIWNVSTPQQHEHSSLNLHMHRSGWEVYAKHSLLSRIPKTSRLGSHRGRVKVALHITATSHYRLSIQQHLSRLIFSGLYDIAEGIYCFILGPSDAEIKTAAKFVQRFGRKAIVAGNSTETSLYERFTLLGIRAHLQPDDFLLYLHTKGLSHPSDDVRIFDWVFYMHYFVVKHFPVCLALIEEHFDTCGVDYHFAAQEKPWIPSEHYSGNFWWARAAYFLSLPESIGDQYLDPEMYIGSGSPRYVALWESNVDMYSTEFSPLEFVDTAAIAVEMPNCSASGARCHPLL